MISSWQVAGMHQQQGQMFGQQAAYSQQLSAQMPQAYGQGLGATGFGGGFSPGGGYSYGGGGGGAGYGPGNSFGNTMTAGLGGVAKSMFGSAGMGMSGAMAGFKMGGLRGAMVGGGLGMLGGAAVSHVVGSAMEGAQEQAGLERTLGQFQFQNAGSRTGKGFNRQDSMGIGNMVRQMERVPEMLTSFGELNKVMDKMGQMGMMQGVRDAGEFQKKFKDMVGTLKDVSKIMGGTMEEALQFVGQSRQSGFYTKGAIKGNALAQSVTSSVTGMSQGQVAGLQQYGADMSRSMGGSRRTGALSLTRSAAQLGMMNQMGVLSNDDIMELTGKEGGAGIQDLAADMGGLAHKMARGNVGNAMTMALGETKDGRFTGNMDQSLVEKVRKGEIGLDELKKLARSKVSTRGAKLSFSANRNRLQAEMAGSVGAEGIGMQLNEILGDRGWSNPDAQALVMKRFGASEDQTKLLQKMMPNLQAIGSGLAEAGQSEAKNSARQAAMKEQGWDAIKHKIGKKLQHYTTDWAKDMGVSVRNYFQNFADEFMDDLSGQYTQKVTKRVSDAMTGGGKGLARMQGYANKLSGNTGMRMDIGQSGGASGFLARGAHWAGGGESQGERLDKIMGGVDGGRGLHRLGRGNWGGADELAASGKYVLDSTNSGRASYTTQSEMDAVSKKLTSGNFGKDESKKFRELAGDSSADKMVETYQEMMRSGALNEISDPLKRKEAIYAKLREVNKQGMSAMEIADERKGEYAVSGLGKARQGGMGDIDIVASVQAMAEEKHGKRRGRADWTKLAGGMGGDLSTVGISKRRGAIEKKFGSIEGGGELMTMLDKGGMMGNLAEGALSKDSGQILQDALNAEDAGDLNKIEGLDAALAKFGISKADLVSKLGNADGKAELDRLGKLVGSGKFKSEDVEELLGTKFLEGRDVIAKRVREKGGAMSERLAGMDKTKLTSASKDAQEVLTKYAGDLNKVDAGNIVDKDGKFNSVFGDSASVAEKLAGIDGGKYGSAERKALVDAGGPETKEMLSRYQGLVGYQGKRGHVKGSLEGLIGKGNKGGDLDAVLKQSGGDKLDDETKANIEKAIGGKGGRLDSKEEMKEVVKILMETESKLKAGKEGEEQKSTAANEKEIAETFLSMSKSQEKLATMIGNIATNKPVGENLPQEK